MAEDRKILWTHHTNNVDSILYEDMVDIEWQPEVKSVRITEKYAEKKNSMPIAFWCWLTDFIYEKVNKNDDIKSWVLACDPGTDFGGGNDARELGGYIGYGTGKTKEEQKRPTQRSRMIPDRDVVFGNRGIEQAIHRGMKTSIFEVRGMCYGQHFTNALVADIVIAEKKTLFTHPAYRYLGPFGNTNILIENLGVKKAKECILTAKPMVAEEMSGNGLCTQVVDEADLRKTTDDYVKAISLLPLDGICMGHGLIEQGLENRGYGLSFVQSWTGHGWFTNLSYGENEFNFLKYRRDMGLKEAMYYRDKQAPKAWRMGRARYEDD
ncbi:MAG: enoyl-CoA hydratase/isomerase family protein [Dehalococcoidia bacterium]